MLNSSFILLLIKDNLFCMKVYFLLNHLTCLKECCKYCYGTLFVFLYQYNVYEKLLKIKIWLDLSLDILINLLHNQFYCWKPIDYIHSVTFTYHLMLTEWSLRSEYHPLVFNSGSIYNNISFWTGNGIEFFIGLSTSSLIWAIIFLYLICFGLSFHIMSNVTIPWD